MRKLTLNILQPVKREKLRLRSACASMQSGLCLCFPLAAFVISCSAGLSSIEVLQPLGPAPETWLHGLLGDRPLGQGCQLKLVGGTNNIVVNRYTLELSVWINSCNRHSASSILICCFTILTS